MNGKFSFRLLHTEIELDIAVEPTYTNSVTLLLKLSSNRANGKEGERNKRINTWPMHEHLWMTICIYIKKKKKHRHRAHHEQLILQWCDARASLRSSGFTPLNNNILSVFKYWFCSSANQHYYCHCSSFRCPSYSANVFPNRTLPIQLRHCNCLRVSLSHASQWNIVHPSLLHSAAVAL